MSMADRRKALYQGLEARVIDALVQAGVAPPLHQHVAATVLEAIGRGWGGQVIYFPRVHDRQINDKWDAIASQFNGSNYAELASLHGYTERHIRKIIKRVALKKRGAIR